jgi:hypothetical protein
MGEAKRIEQKDYNALVGVRTESDHIGETEMNETKLRFLSRIAAPN